MAKTDPDLNDDTILIDDYTPPTPSRPDEKAGPYDRHVLAALEADNALRESDPESYEAGKRKRVSIVVPNGDSAERGEGEDAETFYPDVEKERRLFQDSARFRDRTAKNVGTVDQGDGFTRLSFILIPKQTRPRLTPEEKAARDAEKETSQNPEK